MTIARRSTLAAAAALAAALSLPARRIEVASACTAARVPTVASTQTHVGPNGGVTTVDRSKGADGTTNDVDRTQGQGASVTRSKEAPMVSTDR
jgi:hypothetical protein